MDANPNCFKVIYFIIIRHDPFASKCIIAPLCSKIYPNNDSWNQSSEMT